MKKIILILFICTLFTQQVFALPIGILFVGADFFIILFSFLVSSISIFFFYIKNLKTLHKYIFVFISILFLFLIFFLNTQYHKQQILKEYIDNINNLGLYDYYHENNYVDDKFIKASDVNIHSDEYLLIDIREESEYYNLEADYKFNNIRFPDLIKNHNSILKSNNKPILITCWNGNRGKIVSGFLNNLGYNAYYIKGGLRDLNIDYGSNKKYITHCENVSGKNIYVGIDDNDSSTIDIAYMQLTDQDIFSILDHFIDTNILNKNENIILSCQSNKGLNCGVGRQSFGKILQDKGFENICLGESK